MKLRWFNWRLLLLGVVAGILIGGPAVLGKAAQTPPTNFFATPFLPKNQLTTKVGYFDLKVMPGTTQDLKLAVTNPGSTQKTLQVIPVNATTSDSGNAVYVPSNRTDPSAQTTFTKMTSGAVTITLASHQEKTVTFKTTIPTGGFQGEVLGGLFVTDPQASPAASQNGGASSFRLHNRYAVVTAVALWCHPNQRLTTMLKLGDVAIANSDTNPVVQAKIRNLTPALFGDLQGTARIIKTDTGQQVARQDLKRGSMAPNSWFNYGVPLGNKPLTAGRYTLNLHLTSGKRVWDFTHSFSLTKNQAKAHNTIIRPEGGIDWWFWLLLALLLALLIFGAYWLGKRRSRS